MSKSRNDKMFGNHKHPGDSGITKGIPTGRQAAKDKVFPADNTDAAIREIGTGPKLASRPAARGKIIVKTQAANMGLAAGGILSGSFLGGMRKTKKGFGKG